MTNFNPINNNFNIYQNFASQKANIVQDNQNQAINQYAQNQSMAQFQQQQTQINPNLLINYEAVKMTNEQILKYLLSMLELPSSIDKFINELNNPKSQDKTIKLLVENLLSTKALNEFLNQNSTNAINKLLNVISTTLKQGREDISQLKDILNILTSIQQSSTINTNTLKEFLLLYIPLDIPVFDKQSELKNLDEEKTKAINTSTLSIMLETISFSNMLCLINASENQLFLDIYSREYFPYEKFDKIIKLLAQNSNVNLSTNFKITKSENKESTIQNFKVNSKGNIPLNVLLIAQMSIKTIFKLDKDYCYAT